MHRNTITNSTFHEKLPDDEQAGSKHVTNVHNNAILLVIYYESVDGCTIILYMINNRMQTKTL
jgi:hypothetical protein